MPGPGQKNKKGAAKKPSTSNQANRSPILDVPVYIGDIDNAKGWHVMALRLCEVLKIPGGYWLFQVTHSPE
jgi:hypothetical protein